MSHDDGGDAPTLGGLADLLRRNREWTDDLPDDYFEGVRDSQSPGVVSVCCSDSRVSQEGMFGASGDAGSLFTPSSIGNKVIAIVGGERAVDGSFQYGLAHAGAAAGVVVGHTGCGAIATAYTIATGEDPDLAPGIAQEVAPVVETVEAALDGGAVDTDATDREVVNRLVEYNVDAQIDFLRGSEVVAEETDLYGFVYDFQGAYGDVDGRTVLVNVDGETDPDALREEVPTGDEEFVGRLLE